MRTPTVASYSTHRLQNRYNQARYSLLLIVAFTVINAFLLITESGSYFLFSANLPYFFIDLGMALCGLYSPEFLGLTPEQMASEVFLPIPVFVILLVLALFVLTMYTVMTVLSSKQRYGWLIAALVMWVIDTASLSLYDFNSNMIIEIGFHIFFIVELVLGIHAAIKLQTMPPEALAAAGMDTNPDIPFDITLPVDPVDPIVPTDAPTTDTPAEATADADAPATQTAPAAEEGVCGIPDAPTIPDAPEIQ